MARASAALAFGCVAATTGRWLFRNSTFRTPDFPAAAPRYLTSEEASPRESWSTSCQRFLATSCSISCSMRSRRASTLAVADPLPSADSAE